MIQMWCTRIWFNLLASIKVMNVPLRWLTCGPVGATRFCSSYNHAQKKKAAPLVDWAGNIELLDSEKGHEGKFTTAALSVNIRQESWEDIRFI